MLTHGPPGSGPSYTTLHPEAPLKRKRIRILPRIIKKSKRYNPNPWSILADPFRSPIELTALFDRRMVPTILTDIQDPANTPPTVSQETTTNVPLMAAREETAKTLSTVAQDLVDMPAAVVEDLVNMSPAAVQDLTNMSPTGPGQQISSAPATYDMD